MRKRLDQKGFTLVELLAVLVILVAIMGIAIPTISSSLERTKESQNQSRYKVLESAAELYVSDHKNQVYANLGSNTQCYIPISAIDFLSAEEMQDSDGNDLSGNYVIFTKSNSYQYSTSTNGLSSCI